MDVAPRINHLLAIGPLPPPPSGSNVSFQVFCDYLTECTHVDTLTVIDSSPKRIKANTSILTTKNLRQATRILVRFWQELRSADCAVIFGSNQFLLSLTPLLVFVAQLRGKPCFVRSFGGSLDQFSDRLNPLLQSILLWGFRNSNGLLVETMLLYRHFTPLLPGTVQHVTAYRPLPSTSTNPAIDSLPTTQPSPPINGSGQLLDDRFGGGEQLKLLFISWVRAEKGVRDLLEALQMLTREERARISCTIYGPIVDDYAVEFERDLVQNDSVRYCGEIENSLVLETMSAHDLLVFPTYYQGEGYPGVIVESMSAGLPVITSEFRSIPDMVEHGINGLLVPPMDPARLADALRFCLENPAQLVKMGVENKKRQSEYDIRTVLPQMVTLLESKM